MKLILTHEVTGLGAAGDIVEVKDGYGRNYLMPRGLATPWTKGGQKQVDALTKGREVREIKDLDSAKGVKGRLEATSVKVAAKTGKSGRLFGAVSNADIAAAVKAAGGPEIDKRKIEVKTHIKSVGAYEATVRLHADVSANLKFEVVSS
ncbi:50S ribosomal protein L9 [Humibacillus sp. DSM 29435]|uniref:50S ribosomal protein L9 n=1 Tax=Humibacillus sp. DSM 29435 TaxID=1869167 RepID=UPI00087219FC|nr:50S ribosomal protein L9 [Humibacillus sp. DSM 29435]OFE18394.1 50S ribosomal protein L9 [Humibacillus sp. DSM 29435]